MLNASIGFGMYIKDGICYAGELFPDIEVSSLLDKGSAFIPLSKEENRRTAKVTHGFVSWLDGEIDVAPETLYSESYKYSKD